MGTKELLEAKITETEALRNEVARLNYDDVEIARLEDEKEKNFSKNS